MNPTSHPARWRPLAAHVAARTTPLLASGLVHALVIGAVLAIGFHGAPRWRPAVQAELVVLEREVLPTAPMPAPKAEIRRPEFAPPAPVVRAPSLPRAPTPPTPPKAVEIPAK